MYFSPSLISLVFPAFLVTLLNQASSQSGK